MYESRLHATNGIVSIAFDARNAEVLELVNEKNMDNVVKSNCHPKAWSPFILHVPSDKGLRRLVPPRYLQILDDPSLQPVIKIDQQEKSAAIHIAYSAVMEGDEKRDVKVDVDILLPEGSCKSEWKIRVENNMGEEIQNVLFPCLTGMFLGETWTDDQVTFPSDAGLLVTNPVRKLTEAPKVIYWKWQEYNYHYLLNGPCGAKDDRDCHVLQSTYTGNASMLWLDLFDKGENCGVYLTCRNNELRLKGVRIESFGETTPGLGMSLVHFICLNDGKVWNSETCIVGLHEGDWHWAADDYREWRNSLPVPDVKRHRPEWYEKSPGLVAHYDFKYQSQGVVHKFKDIPALLEQAQEMGMNHLLLSGWNYDGFDHGFPQYWPDEEMGTEADLRDAVHEVRAKGGHVAFYINSRLCNTKYEDRAELIKQSAIMRRDGTLKIEQYGARDLKFACLCNQSKPWRDEFCGVVDYLTHDIGADSMYLDQLCMGSGELCYHPDHDHKDDPTAWNQGYAKMLQQMRDHYEKGGMALIYEGASDIHGWGVSGQLISSKFAHFAGSHPELYKYTFPDQILVDMMVPKYNNGMRAAHLGLLSTFFLYRAFVTGSYLWVYDLEMDNTFRRDPKQYERLKKLNALRSAWLEAYGHGTFRDDLGLTPGSETMLAKKYLLDDGLLLACADEKGMQDKWVECVWEGDHLPAAVIRTDTTPDKEVPAVYETSVRDGKTMIRVNMGDAEELAVVILR